MRKAAYGVGSGIALSHGLLIGSATAQITPDNANTVLGAGVTGCAGTCITGGLRDGSGTGPNIFHSFSEFNIGNGQTVTFDNAPNVANIFSRVTGPTASSINGTLGVNGPANLFLLNPQGILFGENAKLSIPGSFLSTTAESIQFQNNAEFNADINSAVPSLLSINVPIGVQFGASPNPINIQGSGHNFSLLFESLVNNFGRTAAEQLTLGSRGQVMSFLGGDVNLQGGILTSETGHIEIGSIKNNGLVAFDSSSSDWAFDYSNIDTFGDINLSQRSAIDVSGRNPGSIQLQGRQINLSEGSTVFAQVRGNGGGQITLNASESISLIDNINGTPSTVPTSVYINSVFNPRVPVTTDGSSLLSINTPRLSLTAGAQLGMHTSANGPLGNMNITAQTITLNGGRSRLPSGFSSRVIRLPSSLPAPTGNSANINISTNEIRVTDGAQIKTTTFGLGSAGNILIAPDATGTSSPTPVQLIEVSGSNGDSVVSQISSASERPPGTSGYPSGSGNSGNIELNAQQIRVADGGQVAVATLSNSPAGDLSIRASDSIVLDGQIGAARSGLFASALVGTGDGGNIQIKTPQLSLNNGATINASNFPSVVGTQPGQGAAGNIEVLNIDSSRTSRIELDNDSIITAAAVSGNSANVTLQSDSLVMRQGSSITTNATGNTTGGNIKLTTTALIALENSDITANAEDDFGGRVVVNAQTILGTAYREQLTAESDITASSALGPAFSGTVEINDPAIDPADGINQLPEGLSAEQQIVAACEQLESNTFVATGRGGLPTDASQLVTGDAIWTDFRFSEEVNILPSIKNDTDLPHNEGKPNTTEVSVSETIIEAQNWSYDSEGQIVLGHQQAASLSPQMLAQCTAAR